MAQNFYINQSTLGADFQNGSATALFAVGTHVLGNNGTEWVYVQANTSISGLTVVAINTVSYTCGMASGLDLTNGSQIAFAQTSISSQAYGWVAIRGLGLTVISSGSCTAPTAAGVFLAASGIRTGALGCNTSASGTLAGVSIVDATDAATAGVGDITINVTWPRPASTVKG